MTFSPAHLDRRVVFLGLALPALAAAAPAQTFAEPTVVGWVDQGPRTLGGVHAQVVNAACPKARALYSVLNGGVLFAAGGAAYEPRSQVLWVSNGAEIAGIRIADGSLVCRFRAMRMDPNAVVSGLAVTAGGKRLLQLETRAGYAGMRSYDLRACPPAPLRDGCKLALGRSEYAAGLSYDPIRDLVHYTVTQPLGTFSRNTLMVAKEGDRCRPLCKALLPHCQAPLLGTDVTGLAFDGCTGLLYVTFGGKTAAFALGDPLRCAPKLVACCPKGFGAWFKGIALVPGWRQQPFGKGCVGKGCPFCSKLRMRLAGGDPVPGNDRFAFVVENAPAQALGVLVLAAGRCTKGVGHPFLCGAIYPSLRPAPAVLDYGVLRGKGQCLASGTIAAPIPSDPSLCGATLCAQSVVLCAGRSGLGMTQGIEFTLGR